MTGIAVSGRSLLAIHSLEMFTTLSYIFHDTPASNDWHGFEESKGVHNSQVHIKIQEWFNCLRIS
jgi:hypothetical protein